MVKDFEDSVIFSGTEEFDKRSPAQNMLLDIIEMVNRRILYFYFKEAAENTITPPEMLIMVTANIFSNLSHNLIFPRDGMFRLKAFETMNEELSKLNSKLFMTLETYYADEKQVN